MSNIDKDQRDKQFFRDCMSDKRVAKDFFQAHLPKDILERVDLDSLELYNPFTDEESSEENILNLPMVFRAPIDNQKK